MSIGDCIRYWRQQRKLTQRQLAGLAGLYPTTVSELERGKVQPRLPTLKAIAKALNIDPALLLVNNKLL